MNKKREPIAIDFESYYDSSYGISECGVYNYIHDDLFNPYLIAIHGAGISWVGDPRDFDWSLLPKEYDGLAHNAGFDRLVFDRCIEMGIIPESARPKAWYCTANLSVFLGGPRNLKDAAKQLLDRVMSKEMRDYMRGKTWQEAVDDGKAEQLRGYAMDDAINCYDIWVKYESQWPEVERRVAELTFLQTQRGVRIDIARLDAGIPKVRAARDAALARIPWAGEMDPSGDEWKPTSSKALKQWCIDKGIEPPVTTEAKSPEFKEWIAKHPEAECVKAMQTYRSANAWLLKAERLRRQVNPNGRYNFALLYFGASTGRWSGGFESDRADTTGFNIQNLVKGEHYGLDLRACLIPEEGKKFIILDFSQIEPRSLMWMTDDRKSLELIRKGMPLYEVHARTKMGWTGGNLKQTGGKTYDLAKARVIALGYSTGGFKLLLMCSMFGIPLSIFEDPVTPADHIAFKRYLARCNQTDKVAEYTAEVEWVRAINAWKIVQDYRASETGITDFWKMLENDCKRCANGTYTVELPSGRLLRYFNIKTLGGLTGQKMMGGLRIKLFGGFLTENVTQAFGRDVLRDSMLRTEDSGYPSLWHAHDEVIYEVDMHVTVEEIRLVMIQQPDWAPGLPLDVAGEEAMYYKK